MRYSLEIWVFWEPSGLKLKFLWCLYHAQIISHIVIVDDVAATNNFCLYIYILMDTVDFTIGSFHVKFSHFQYHTLYFTWFGGHVILCNSNIMIMIKIKCFDNMEKNYTIYSKIKGKVSNDQK